MRSWLLAIGLGLGMGSLVPVPHAEAAPRENRSSTSEESDTTALRRVGYRAPEGAMRISRVFPSKSGDEVAFFERQDRRVSLVVAIKGGVEARWPMSADVEDLAVFWLNKSEIVLGPDLLTPKMRVKWYVAQR